MGKNSGGSRPHDRGSKAPYCGSRGKPLYDPPPEAVVPHFRFDESGVLVEDILRLDGSIYLTVPVQHIRFSPEERLALASIGFKLPVE